MEPLKALTLIVVAGTVSLVGAGAAGFYAGYSAGRGNIDEIKAHLASVPVGTSGAVAPTAVSLKPVLEDIRALSKQVEALSATTKPVAAAADQAANLKPVLEEIRALARQSDSSRAQGAAVPPPPKPMDYSDDLNDIRNDIKALTAKIEKQEPKAPKVLVDEIRSLSASIQSQEPAARKAIVEEIRNAVATLQNSENRLPKAFLDEIKVISASVRAQDTRPQSSVGDQIKVLNASIEGLKTKVPDQLAEDLKRITLQVQALAERGPQVGGASAVSAKSDAALAADVAQLRQLVTTASDQFGRCQTQLATLTNAAMTQPQGAPAAVATTAVAVSQGPRTEPSAVVFYDNVMLRKDQEKQYEEIGVRLSLQAVTPRQVRVAVNKQGFGLSFGERKVFRSQDVECELNLMETNLNDGQARVSISCKR